MKSVTCYGVTRPPTIAASPSSTNTLWSAARPVCATPPTCTTDTLRLQPKTARARLKLFLPSSLCIQTFRLTIQRLATLYLDLDACRARIEVLTHRLDLDPQLHA